MLGSEKEEQTNITELKVAHEKAVAEMMKKQAEDQGKHTHSLASHSLP